MKRVYYNTATPLKANLYGALAVDQLLGTDKTIEMILLYVFAMAGLIDGDGISEYQVKLAKDAYNAACDLLEGLNIHHDSGKNVDDDVK